MSENTNEKAVEAKPTAKKSAAKKSPAKKTTTSRVAESNDAITTSVFEEAKEVVNDDGQEVITGPKKEKAESAPASNTKANDEGVIGSRSAERLTPKKETKKESKSKKDDKILIWSPKSIRWQGVGTLSPGYNVVTKEAAEKWLTRSGIREASAEEVATYYGA